MFDNEWGGAVAMTKIEEHWLWGHWVMINHERLLDGKWHTKSHECVAIAQETLRMPNAKDCWRRGKRVLGNGNPDYYAGHEIIGSGIVKGTIIATFDENGRYPSDAHGNHVAIYLEQGKNYIKVIDQWKSLQAPHTRTIYVGGGGLSNDADAFSVVFTTQGAY